ncbi:hypothetical protein HDV05_005481 [Chytridiales sp. JEL 0842]|nr:hypothetical protein HDV05_005481 [Chytridiales sp. JEL 0842]
MLFTQPILTVLALLVSTATSFTIQGSNIIDANGNPFIMRGINHGWSWYRTQNQAFGDIKNTGSNTVRIVLTGADTVQDVRSVISESKKHRLVAVVENHDATGCFENYAAKTIGEVADWWVRVKDAVIGEEDYVIVNIANEPFGNVQFSMWADETKKAVKKLRDAGIKNMLMLDAPNWGQDWSNNMRDNAASVLAADPLKNAVFSIHMYGVYATPTKVKSYVDFYLNNSLPLVIGEFGSDHSDGAVDEQTIISYSREKNVGWLAWSWSGNTGGVEYLDLVQGFNKDRPSAWGRDVFKALVDAKEASVYGPQVPPTPPQTTNTPPPVVTTRPPPPPPPQTTVAPPPPPPQTTVAPPPLPPQTTNRPPSPPPPQTTVTPSPPRPQTTSRPLPPPSQTTTRTPTSPSQTTNRPPSPPPQTTTVLPPPPLQTTAPPPSTTDAPIHLHIASDPTLNPPNALSDFSCNNGLLQGALKLDLSYTYPLSPNPTYKHMPLTELGLPRVKATFTLPGASGAPNIQIWNSWNSNNVKADSNTIEFDVVTNARTTGFFAVFGPCRPNEPNGPVDPTGRIVFQFESSDISGAQGLGRGYNGGPSVGAFNGKVKIVNELGGRGRRRR